MSVEQVIAMLRTMSSRGGELGQQRAAVQLAMQVLPYFGDAVCAQMRWNNDERPVDSTRHVEALRPYFDQVPGLETAYCAVLMREPEMLDSSPYFGSP